MGKETDLNFAPPLPKTRAFNNSQWGNLPRRGSVCSVVVTLDLPYYFWPRCSLQGTFPGLPLRLFFNFLNIFTFLIRLDDLTAIAAVHWLCRPILIMLIRVHYNLNFNSKISSIIFTNIHFHYYFWPTCYISYITLQDLSHNIHFHYYFLRTC